MPGSCFQKGKMGIFRTPRVSVLLTKKNLTAFENVSKCRNKLEAVITVKDSNNAEVEGRYNTRPTPPMPLVLTLCLGLSRAVSVYLLAY